MREGKNVGDSGERRRSGGAIVPDSGFHVDDVNGEECNFANAREPLNIISAVPSGVLSRVTVPVIVPTVAGLPTFVGAVCCAAASEDSWVGAEFFPSHPARTTDNTPAA